jgi:signal transduction histidine kinase
MSSLATSHVDAKPDVKNDVTEEIRLAITEALGTVAHELRQPLSNIEAVAYYLSMILPPGDAKIQLQLARIRELVEQSDLILSNALGLEAAPAAGSQSGESRA